MQNREWDRNNPTNCKALFLGIPNNSGSVIGSMYGSVPESQNARLEDYAARKQNCRQEIPNLTIMGTRPA